MSLVRKLRRSALVAVQGRLPIQMPYSERFGGAEGSAGTSSSDAEAVCKAIMLLLSDLGPAGVALPLLALRRAFLEGGSGAVTSISSSPVVLSSRFRFLDGDSGGVIMAAVSIAVEWRPIVNSLVTSPPVFE